jgi:hypothetical protein
MQRWSTPDAGARATAMSPPPRLAPQTIVRTPLRMGVQECACSRSIPESWHLGPVPSHHAETRAVPTPPWLPRLDRGLQCGHYISCLDRFDTDVDLSVNHVESKERDSADL